MTATVEPVVRIDNFSEFVEVLGGDLEALRVAARLSLLAGRLKDLAIRWCNGDIDDEQQTADRAPIETAVNTLCTAAGLTPKFGHDPRGCMLAVALPGGQTNNWTQDGWCVPTLGSHDTLIDPPAPVRKGKPILLREDARAVLAATDIEPASDGWKVTINGDNILPPNVFTEVAAVLTGVGGRWQRARRCYLFDRDPAGDLYAAAATGEWLDGNKLHSYFPTPDMPATRTIDLAGIEPGMTVLEPSAGEGHLLRHLPDGCHIVAVESDEHRATRIRAGGYDCHRGDFLAYARQHTARRFDRVVMNPPFTTPGRSRAWRDHTIAAARLVKPGGRLVAILPASAESDTELAELGDITWEALPEGAFNESGTSVRTVIAVIDVPVHSLTVAQDAGVPVNDEERAAA